jgi:hypothetical protein
VLIAGELRTLGNLRGADNLLRRHCSRRTISRADALTERARLREDRGAARRPWICAKRTESARLKLDFNRIDTSSALALALLAATTVGRVPPPTPRSISECIRELSESRVAHSVGELRALRGSH